MIKVGKNFFKKIAFNVIKCLRQAIYFIYSFVWKLLPK